MPQLTVKKTPEGNWNPVKVEKIFNFLKENANKEELSNLSEMLIAGDFFNSIGVDLMKAKINIDDNILNEDQIREQLIESITGNVESIDTEAWYDDLINEITDTENIPSFMGDPAQAMKENDPIAYRCGMADYLDSIRDEVTEIEGDYYRNDEIEQHKETFSDSLQDDLWKIIDSIEP